MIPRLRFRASLGLLLLVLVPGVALAQGGLNLRWSDCGQFGTAVRTFACNTNSGTNTMVASFVAPVPMPHLVGQEAVIDLCSMTAVLPSWWQMFVSGSCRPTAMSTSFDFTSGPFNCADPWQGQAFGGMDYTIGYSWQFNSARIRAVCAVAANTIPGIDNETEYYAFKVTIKNEKTVGVDACAGCLEHVCIVFNSDKLVQPLGEGDYTITGPLMSQYMQWQGGVVGCPFVVPTKSTSWGQVKSMYR